MDDTTLKLLTDARKTIERQETTIKAASKMLENFNKRTLELANMARRGIPEPEWSVELKRFLKDAEQAQRMSDEIDAGKPVAEVLAKGAIEKLRRLADEDIRQMPDDVIDAFSQEHDKEDCNVCPANGKCPIQDRMNGK